MGTFSTPRSAAPEAQLLYGTAHYAPPAHPAEIDFAAWLAERTPDGAPTMLIAAPGARAPLALPVIRDPSLSPPRRRSRRRRGTAPAVHAALLIDLEGLTPRQVAGDERLPFGSDRAARQFARDGRFVAAELGVWPWAVVDGQPLPRNWWTDERHAVALEAWALPHLPTLAARQLGRRAATVRLPVA